MESSRSEKSPSDNVVVRKAKDLKSEVRVWVCSLFGRELADDEEVAVALPDAATGQVKGDRAQARRALLASMEHLGERFRNVADDDMEAALDEAMKAVRPSFEPRT